MKKNIGFGLLVFFALLICFLFAQQAAYHVVSIFLIVPSVVAVIFYRRRGLVYAALILLAALMIPVFINKDPLAIAESGAVPGALSGNRPLKARFAQRLLRLRPTRTVRVVPS